MTSFTPYIYPKLVFVGGIQILKEMPMPFKRKSKEKSKDYRMGVSQEVSQGQGEGDTKSMQNRIRKPVALYMGDAMKEQLEKMATDHDLSRGAAIRIMIREGLKSRGYGMILD